MARQQVPRRDKGWGRVRYSIPPYAQARFRVTWIAAPDESSEKQIGAEWLEPGNKLWGERFAEQPDDYEEKE